MPKKNGSTYGLAVMQDPFFCTFYGLSSLCLLKIIKMISVIILTIVPVKSIKFSNVINPEDPVAVTAMSSNVVFSII